MIGLRVLRVRCPKCNGQILTEIRPEVMLDAKNSPSGLTAVAVPHSDHVLLIYIDANGHMRGLRVANIVPAEVLESEIR